MPHPAPLRSGDPRRVGRYQLTGRLEGIPTEDPIFIGASPDGSQVAITVLSGDWALDAAARDRFAAEAAVARRVPPFCAARVLDAGLDGPQAYLVSEYIQGQSLLERVSADGVRRAHDLEAVAIGMATGLASVHQAGLVHGSFGPEFVIMAADGSPRVVEFGITPPYGEATPAADMLAWAQTVVFAATGHPPATLDDLDVLPDHLRDTVARCLDPEPAERPAARAVVQSLLGTQDLPAGLLAEGSRRAVRPARAGSQYAQDRLRPADQAAASDRTAAWPAAARPGTSEPGAGEASAGHAGASEASAGEPGAAAPGAVGAGEAGEHADRGMSSGQARYAEVGDAVRRAQSGFARRRTGWLVSGTILIVIVVAAILSRVLLGGGGHASNGQLSANTGVTSGSAASSAARSASPSQPVAPAAFDGGWSGVVTQPPTDTYNVTITFTPGATAGTISYLGTDFSCSGALAITQASATKLAVSQTIIQGKSACEDGLATITLTGPNKIWFSFHSSGPIASGTLAHQ